MPNMDNGEQINLDEARRALGLRSLADLGRMLGYTGSGVRQQMHNVKTGKRPLGEPHRRLLQAYLDGYRPPDWPGGE